MNIFIIRSQWINLNLHAGDLNLIPGMYLSVFSQSIPIMTRKEARRQSGRIRASKHTHLIANTQNLQRIN